MSVCVCLCVCVCVPVCLSVCVCVCVCMMDGCTCVNNCVVPVKILVLDLNWLGMRVGGGYWVITLQPSQGATLVTVCHVWPNKENGLAVSVMASVVQLH